MKFKVQGRIHIVRGSSAPKVITTTKQQLCKAFAKVVHLSIMHLVAEEDQLLYSLTTHADQEDIPMGIENLLQEFVNIFQEPQ